MYEAPQPLQFQCVGNNTWTQIGGPIIAARKGVDLSTANTDFAVNLPSIKWVPGKVLVTAASVSLAGSPAKLGLFTGSGGTGSTVITPSLLTSLTTSASFATAATGLTSTVTATTVFIRCTVAHTAPATVDVYFYGDILP